MGEWQQQYLQAVDPVESLRGIVVTGTNGKTTISRLIAELISSQGQGCAVMGTTGNGILPNLTPSTHTTLDALHLQQALQVAVMLFYFRRYLTISIKSANA